MVNQVRPAGGATSPTTLRSGQLAALAGVNIETLRFYEREGLLERPYQHPSGYRAYPAKEVAKVQAIKRAQALGFKLAEIRDLLKGASTGQVSELATQKLQEIEVSIAHLVLAREELTRLVEFRCDRLLGCSCGQAGCPVYADRQAADEMGPGAPALQIVRGRRTGLLAAIGIPALTVAGGTEIGIAGAAVAATGVGVVQLRKRRTRRGGLGAK